MRLHRVLGLFAMLAALTLLGACASTGNSTIPWATPQPWEGSPSLPGFSGDGTM